MNADDLVKILLERTHDMVVEEACEFFKKHDRLKKIKASQMNALRTKWEKSKDWASLEKNLEKFLKHQEDRDKKVGVSGWKDLAERLITTLQELYDTSAANLADILENTSEEISKVSAESADDMRYFLADPKDAIRQERLVEAKYYLAKDFLACLYRLHRSREVLDLPLESGELYSQGDCHVDF
ncbi:MAG: hypothetical protein PHW74_10430 [Desulfobacca sp.]|nr:hypothetical protein [Desulfobacca sp.]